MGVTITLDYNAIHAIEKAVVDSAVDALEAVCTDLVNAQTMPFNDGNMQNGGTYPSGITVKGNEVIILTDSKDEIHVCITNDAPQSRRLYYHPEYNFQRGKNPNAGAYWLEPYISGNKKDFVMAEFTEIFKRRSGT